MAKEMIVSVNGREKKIAILDDGKVTEFYIERGEENSGVVGNIYKGRVMRVLPGMQSAFVDIGLERDAFLYVSDFFDEEEEFERIVMEKAKKTDVGTAEKAASEKLQQNRLEREQAMEAAQERSEPLFAAETPKKDFGRQPAKPIQPIAPPVFEEIEESKGIEIAAQPTQKFEKIADDDLEETGAASNAASYAANSEVTLPEISRVAAKSFADIEENADSDTAATPFAFGESGFERVVDDEAEMQPGEQFKDAKIQERLTDQVRAVEFEIEPTPSIEVGTLILDQGGSGFERIADDEDAETETVQTPPATDAADSDESEEKPVRRGRTARRGKKTDAKTAANAETDAPDENAQTEDESVSTDADEISDAESSAETSAETAGESANRKKRRGGRRNSPDGRRTKSPSNASETAADNDETGGENFAEAEDAQSSEPIGDSSIESENRRGDSVESLSRDSRGNDSIETVSGSESSVESIGGSESGETSVSDAITQSYGDASAGVNDLSQFREPMAVRRGGRRRRGGSNRTGNRPENGEGEDQTDDATDDAANDNAADAVEIEEPTNEDARSEPARRESPAPRHARADNQRNEPQRAERNGRSERNERPERNQRTERAERPEQRGERNERNERNERSERNERPERGERSDRPERAERSSRDRRPPTITDLLREGQEVLVQIAKEPIAKKGARITSHIALPGRYIVYMPTIEHVGVSRKIESSSERVRLRGMIQKIRQEEDVPSGGFIVRTAGVGITEQNLRDDARYLVRTWLDIRKSGEKAKSPNLVHQDLDLVERILRDQLSDDFAAIRVDDESEYLRVVEFINRIQPRMTNRVKLYTRDEPIMEAYGVQEEIDKAVKPRVWLKSGGYLVINQTEALVSIDVNTGKYVGGRGANNRLEDTITKTNLEAVDEIARQVRLRDLGGIIVLDLIDMEDKRNRQKVLQALQDALQGDKSPTKVLSFNDFGLVIMTRKRVKQSLERTLCAPCHYCEGAGLIKSPQTIAYEILAEARRMAKGFDDGIKGATLRVHPEIAKALRSTERDVLTEIEDYLGAVDLTSDAAVHQEQFDFAFV